MSHLDDFDRRILAELQKDGRISNADLADRIGLSPTPCLRRVKALEKAGYIQGYRAELAPSNIGLGLTVMVGVRIAVHREEQTSAIQEAFKALPEVIAGHLVSGETDYLLEVVVPDLQAYERFLVGKLLKFPEIKDVRSSFVIRTVKDRAPFPLDHLEK
ncbi:Lrp/AsnC family transcriptional regulator [Telmatospirillum siberiense]|uniref:AsnC family transcriptional regulator n=1 Tax=Telmatospirillum siberiense TaxID=382514 RepID=A0A2N3PV34_9PROT|nr:Lrp/AsnC family transcriptional regulator [Telmatospirillum siberiense]PKU24265.1 AsnC family transcriptional regulator [Telmatospirillum siberiense]